LAVIVVAASLCGNRRKLLRNLLTITGRMLQLSPRTGNVGFSTLLSRINVIRSWQFEIIFAHIGLPT